LTAVATVYLRLALAAGFLTAVTDRFGWWGPHGTENVAWGDFRHFLDYAAKLNPWFPAFWIPAVGWFVTAAELLLGICLLLGIRTRNTTFLAALLLFAFGCGMTARYRSQVGTQRLGLLGIRRRAAPEQLSASPSERRRSAAAAGTRGFDLRRPKKAERGLTRGDDSSINMNVWILGSRRDEE
jgi:uncharacterized membrane protein YphA (DoxX/SURF4 family)